VVDLKISEQPVEVTGGYVEINGILYKVSSGVSVSMDGSTLIVESPVK
jgi:hypothetical protein